MSKKLYSISIFAVAFALVLGFGAANAKASDNYNLDYGQTNLFAVDEAHNSIGGLSDRDKSTDDIQVQNRALPSYSEER